ncbi:MAG: sulfide-dependent adenosine diphosphate thiazole synthase [bacterium]|nr:sulfide-dependent adenosine diphosphate thiazole synthase [bacterium]
MDRLDDVAISRAIIEEYTRDFSDSLESDVAIVGAGPAGMVAGYYLARAGRRVAIFERRLSVGGGMWGGGIMFGRCIFQEASRPVLDEIGVRVTRREDGYYVTDSVETVAVLCAAAVKAGARVFNSISTEDVLIRGERVAGIVLNWSAVSSARLHVDPISARAGCVVDATGHDAEIARIVVRKIGKRLRTETGDLLGERPMWAEVGERTIVEHTGEIYPGLWVAGMAANAVFGGPRMGPIFGGMLLSGRRAAEMILAAPR